MIPATGDRNWLTDAEYRAASPEAKAQAERYQRDGTPPTLPDAVSKAEPVISTDRNGNPVKP
jgi:hypothetical protein